MAGSITDLLSSIQNGVIAFNNLTTQMKGSFNNIKGQLTALQSVSGKVLSVHLSSAKSLTTGARTQIPFNIVAIDTYNAYNATTFQYIPPAGTYLVGFNAFVTGTSAAGYDGIADIRLNGTITVEGSFIKTTAGGVSETTSLACGLITINSTTDFIDFAVYTDLTVATCQSNQPNTSVWAMRIL